MYVSSIFFYHFTDKNINLLHYSVLFSMRLYYSLCFALSHISINNTCHLMPVNFHYAKIRVTFVDNTPTLYFTPLCFGRNETLFHFLIFSLSHPLLHSLQCSHKQFPLLATHRCNIISNMTPENEN